MTNTIVTRELSIDKLDNSINRINCLLRSLRNSTREEQLTEEERAIREVILVLENIEKYFNNLNLKTLSQEEKKTLDFFYFYLLALENASPDKPLRINSFQDIEEFHLISEANTEYPEALRQARLFKKLSILCTLLTVGILITGGLLAMIAPIILSCTLWPTVAPLAVAMAALAVVAFILATTLILIVLMAAATIFSMAKVETNTEIIVDEKNNFYGHLDNIASAEIVKERPQKDSLNTPLVFFNTHYKSYSRKSARGVDNIFSEQTSSEERAYCH